MKHVLVIAGSDPSGGAGVQADLTTLKDFSVPALFSITAITAQNDKKVLQIYPTPADLLTQQLSAACMGREVAAVKIGMIANAANVLALVWFLHGCKAKNVVIDPIMHSSSGFPLLEAKALQTFRSQLLPLATVITPNLIEAATMVGFRIHDDSTQVKAAQQIWSEIKSARKPDNNKPLAIIVKGGHLENEAVDVMFDGSDVSIFRAPRIPGASPRGTGCRFSSAVAAGLSKDEALPSAVQKAKDYLLGYIAQSQRS